jgi:hypothetical protein
MRPHSRRRSISETDIDERTPMLARYSRCTGETLRSIAPDRSSGRPVDGVTGGSSGTGRYVASGIRRIQLVSYSARACAGMSLAG